MNVVRGCPTSIRGTQCDDARRQPQGLRCGIRVHHRRVVHPDFSMAYCLQQSAILNYTSHILPSGLLRGGSAATLIRGSKSSPTRQVTSPQANVSCGCFHKTILQGVLPDDLQKEAIRRHVVTPWSCTPAPQIAQVPGNRVLDEAARRRSQRPITSRAWLIDSNRYCHTHSSFRLRINRSTKPFCSGLYGVMSSCCSA